MSCMISILNRIKTRVPGRGYWEDGSGEVIGFMVITPVLAFFLVTFISVIQVGMIQSRLEYAAYAACRAAVVSEDEDEAKKRADKAFELNMADVSAAYDMKSREIVLEPHVVEKSVTTVSSSGIKRVKKLSQGKRKGWEKGAKVTCTVSCDVKTLSDIVTGANPKKSASVTMMIEKGNSMTIDDIMDVAYPG